MTKPATTSIKALGRRLKSRKGQSLVEYALILSFISVLTVAMMSTLGTQVKVLYAPIISVLQAARIAIGG